MMYYRNGSRISAAFYRIKVELSYILFYLRAALYGGQNQESSLWKICVCVQFERKRTRTVPSMFLLIYKTNVVCFLL